MVANHSIRGCDGIYLPEYFKIDTGRGDPALGSHYRKRPHPGIADQILPGSGRIALRNRAIRPGDAVKKVKTDTPSTPQRIEEPLCNAGIWCGDPLATVYRHLSRPARRDIGIIQQRNRDGQLPEDVTLVSWGLCDLLAGCMDLFRAGMDATCAECHAGSRPRLPLLYGCLIRRLRSIPALFNRDCGGNLYLFFRFGNPLQERSPIITVEV